jgi:hypothetical protein
MNFQTITEKETVDFSKLQAGKSVASATLTGFNYNKGFCFGTFEADGKSIRTIVGAQAEYPLPVMLGIKGHTCKLTFAGTDVVDGTTYPRYWLSF